jgi:inhibitor of KinA
MRIKPLGDTALIVEVGQTIDEPTHARVQATLAALEANPLPGVSELVPAYTTVALYYDPVKAIAAGAPPSDVVGWLSKRAEEVVKKVPSKVKLGGGRTVEIPICYDPEFALDLPEIAQKTGLSAEEIVRLHRGSTLLVYMVGFAPGFPYMGGLPPKVSVPRRATPRTRVPAGSVAIIGTQCCIYPIETPGGWNIIGRTPAKLFRPEQNPPVLLRAGDRVKFGAITRHEFENWRDA